MNECDNNLKWRCRHFKIKSRSNQMYTSLCFLFIYGYVLWKHTLKFQPFLFLFNEWKMPVFLWIFFNTFVGSLGIGIGSCYGLDETRHMASRCEWSPPHVHQSLKYDCFVLVFFLHHWHICALYWYMIVSRKNEAIWHYPRLRSRLWYATRGATLQYHYNVPGRKWGVSLCSWRQAVCISVPEYAHLLVLLYCSGIKISQCLLFSFITLHSMLLQK